MKKISMEFDLPHPPAKVWRALTDPGLLTPTPSGGTKLALEQSGFAEEHAGVRGSEIRLAKDVGETSGGPGADRLNQPNRELDSSA